MSEDLNLKLEEFRQLSDRIKDYRNTINRHIMVYLVFTGSMMAFYVINMRDDWFYFLGLPFLGICLTFLFYGVEYRMETYANYYVERAKELERHLGFDIYGSRPNFDMV